MPRTNFFFSSEDMTGSGKSADDSEKSRNNDVEITLSLEEYETIRLIDYSGLNQEQCASQMHVARTTVQRIYTEARKSGYKKLLFSSVKDIGGTHADYAIFSEKYRIYSPKFNIFVVPLHLQWRTGYAMKES